MLHLLQQGQTVPHRLTRWCISSSGSVFPSSQSLSYFAIECILEGRSRTNGWLFHMNRHCSLFPGGDPSQPNDHRPAATNVSRTSNCRFWQAHESSFLSFWKSFIKCNRCFCVFGRNMFRGIRSTFPSRLPTRFSTFDTGHRFRWSLATDSQDLLKCGGVTSWNSTGLWNIAISWLKLRSRSADFSSVFPKAIHLSTVIFLSPSGPHLPLQVCC